MFLTDADRAALEILDAKERIVRDRVQGVIHGHSHGCWIWGEGGIGKSWAAIDELRHAGRPYRITNSKISGKGLFELLEQYPDHIHLLEDAEQLVKNKDAAGVLRSALWAVPGLSRMITWRVSGCDTEVEFTGGIIFTMNMPLDNVPALRALKTRIRHLEFTPTDEEIIAKIKSICAKGYGPLTPAETWEVGEYVIDGCVRLGRGIDIRFWENGCNDRIQYGAGHAKSHWRELIDSSIKDKTTDGRVSLAAIAAEIDAKPITSAEKYKEWEARTGKSSATFKRHRGAVRGTVRTPTVAPPTTVTPKAAPTPAPTTMPPSKYKR